MSFFNDLTVISIEQAVAAPYVSGKLAQAGCRVIKVERPEGDFARNYDTLVNGQSAYFVWLNAGKQSLALDLKMAEDKAVLDAMVEKADIVIQNLAPGALARLGFDFKELRKARPDLILCSISGYGEEGPYANQKAYDLLVQCETGLAGINGADGKPGRVGVSVCDIAAGMTAYQAILEALVERTASGEGRLIEVSLFHALADWMNVPYLQYAYGGKEAVPTGLNHPTIAPYGNYGCKDGREIVFSIQNEREWASFCTKVMNDAALTADQRFSNNTLRVQNREQLEQLIHDRFQKHDRDTMISVLEGAGIAYGRPSSLEDLKNHPQNRFTTVQTPVGAVEILASGAKTDTPHQKKLSIPALDEHGAAIRAEFKA